MGLGLNTGSADGSGGYGKIIKYDARAGRMFRVDREPDASGQYQTDNVEITNGFKAVFDMENVEVGYARFAAGSAPDFRMVKLGEPLPAKPTDDYKQTFRLNLKLDKASGGDIRELASSAKAVINAIDGLHTLYEAEAAKHPGKLPVVAMTGTTPMVSGQGAQKSTNYAPTFQIKSWVDRPADLGGAEVEAQPEPVRTASKGAKHVAPPQAVDNEEDFG